MSDKWMTSADREAIQIQFVRQDRQLADLKAELSRRLDAIEAAKAPPQPSGNTGELKESVGERWALDHVCQGDAGLYITNHDGTMRSDAMTLMLVNARMWIAVAINAAVAEANARADKAEAEVKRLRDPEWIERVPISLWNGTTHPSSIREHFARHAKPKSLK